MRHLTAGRARADDDLLELLRGRKPARGPDRVGELLARRRRRGADLPRRGLEVLLLDRGIDVRRGQPELGDLVRVDPDAHPVLRAADQVDLGDALDAQDRVAEVDHRVVVQELGVVRAVRRVERHEHQDAGVDLLDGHALLDHLLREPRLRLRDAVLDEHVGDVEVHADVEGDVEHHPAVAGVQRLHVDHVVDAVHLLLDRRGDRLLDDLGGGALVGRLDPDRRRRELGYCSTGSRETVTSPTMTIRIEMTIATIGRRMKKSAMGLVVLSANR